MINAKVNYRRDKSIRERTMKAKTKANAIFSTSKRDAKRRSKSPRPYQVVSTLRTFRMPDREMEAKMADKTQTELMTILDNTEERRYVQGAAKIELAKRERLLRPQPKLPRVQIHNLALEPGIVSWLDGRQELVDEEVDLLRDSSLTELQDFATQDGVPEVTQEAIRQLRRERHPLEMAAIDFEIQANTVNIVALVG